MTLLECQDNISYKVVGINTQDIALKDRFFSFGIRKGSEFRLANKAINNLNISILLDGSQVALRDSEAKIVEVVALEN